MTGPLWSPLAVEVLRRGPIPRSELGRRLGLTSGAVTKATRPLVEAGLLVELAPVPSPGLGRPGHPLDVVADSHHFVGVKITKTGMHAVLTTLRAGIVASAVVPLPADTAPAAIVEHIARLVDRLSTRKVSALGVSVGSPVREHSWARVPHLGWSEEVPLAHLLTDRTSLPAVVANDVVAWTEAERWFGAGRVSDSFALVTIGIGVGYGLVVHDRQVVSHDATAGRLRHIPLLPHGPLCPQGHRGCAVAMLNRDAICAAVSSGLLRPVTFPEVFELYRAGDPVARQAVTESASALGHLLALIANLTMTDHLVVSGQGIPLAVDAREVVDKAVADQRDPAAAPLRIDVRAEDFDQWALGSAVAAIQTFVRGVIR